MCKSIQMMMQQILDRLDERSTAFEARFCRAEGMLYFLAEQILGGDCRPDDGLNESVVAAVDNCWHVASVDPPDFDSDGAFHSWLLRILIDEAHLILHPRKLGTPASELQECTHVH